MTTRSGSLSNSNPRGYIDGLALGKLEFWQPPVKDVICEGDKGVDGNTIGRSLHSVGSFASSPSPSTSAIWNPVGSVFSTLLHYRKTRQRRV